MNLKKIKDNEALKVGKYSYDPSRNFLVNNNGEVLCYENKPYSPSGRKLAFDALVESGDIKAPCFSFKKIK